MAEKDEEQVGQNFGRPSRGGEVFVPRNGWAEVEDEDLRENMTEESLEKLVACRDRSIVWSIGSLSKRSRTYAVPY